MWKILFLTIICNFAFSAIAVTIKTTSLVPELFYLIPNTPALNSREYVTIKGPNFVILAKKQDSRGDQKIWKKDEGDQSYWKTVKIRVKNKEVIEPWPYSIKQLMMPLEQATTPKEPVLGVSIFASPISFAVLNNARNVYAGYSVRSLSSTKHELSHDLSLNENYQKDTASGFESSSLVLNSSVIYDYNNFYGNWTYFSIMNYRRQKYNGDYPIKHQFGLGIAGLKYKFIKNAKYIKNFDMSYVPLYEALISDFEVNNPGEEPSKTQKDIRNSFRMRFNLVYEDWTLNYVFYYRPAYYFKIDTLDMQDVDLNSTLSIGTKLSEKVQLNFTNIYTKDIRLYRANGMRPDNTINSFSINVALNI